MLRAAALTAGHQWQQVLCITAFNIYPEQHCWYVVPTGRLFLDPAWKLQITSEREAACGELPQSLDHPFAELRRGIALMPLSYHSVSGVGYDALGEL